MPAPRSCSILGTSQKVLHLWIFLLILCCFNLIWPNCALNIHSMSFRNFLVHVNERQVFSQRKFKCKWFINISSLGSQLSLITHSMSLAFFLLVSWKFEHSEHLSHYLVQKFFDSIDLSTEEHLYQSKNWIWIFRSKILALSYSRIDNILIW